MTFQPFAIYDLRSGLDLSMEPWKTPSDSFTVLNNFMVRRGVLQKRSGQSVFGQLGEFVSAETGFTNPTGNQYTKTLSKTTVIRRSVKVYDDGGAQVLYDGGFGVLAGDGVGTIDYATGAVNVTFTGAIVGSVDCDYHYELAEDTRGIKEFNRYVGTNLLVGFQNKRMSLWETSKRYFKNVPSSAGDYELWNSTELVWTFYSSDYLWITDNSVYNTSGAFPINGIRYYDGSNIKDPIADDSSFKLDAGGTVKITAALIIFSFAERLILLNVVENTTRKPSRAVWSWQSVRNPLDPNAWRRDIAGGGNFKDADTNEKIVSFSFFGDMPIIGFEHSIWTLDSTGDPNNPFDWRRIAGFKDVSATFSGIEYVDSAAFLGGKGLISTNGFKCDNFDKIIPDFVYDIDLDNINKAYAGRADELDQVLLAYPTAPNTSKNNAVLVYNYEDRAFFKYDLSCFCFGNWQTSTDKTFADYAGYTFEDLAGVMWGDNSFQSGYPMLLSGGENGYVYVVNDDQSNTDVLDWSETETIIDFSIETGRLNPFINEGREVVIQQVGFFVKKLDNCEFSVDFYVDEDLDPVYTARIDCSTGDGDKMWVFTDVVATGEFIKIRYYLSDAQKADDNIPLQQIEIHGVLFWAKPGARIKQ